MAKRFTDTEKYKKSFIKSLPVAYKILWDYICLDCNHAGIWHKDFEIAQKYIGADAPVNEDEALAYFNADEERIVPFDENEKWLILPFIGFQYGNLNPKNRVHASILSAVQKSCPKTFEKFFVDNFKGLISPLQGAMEMDKDMDMDKDKDKDKDNKEEREKPFDGYLPARKECGFCNGSGIAIRGEAKGNRCWCRKKVNASPAPPPKVAKQPNAKHDVCKGTGYLPDRPGARCWCWS